MRTAIRALWVVVSLACNPALAGERDFALTWSTRTAPSGANGFEGWVTPRLSRAADTFSLVETRFAWTVGLSPWLEAQTSLDLAFETQSVRAQAGEVRPRASTLWHLAPLKASGIIGLGGTVRASLGPDALELEARLIVDKSFGGLLLALNAAASRTVYLGGGSGVDTRLEESLAIGYALGSAVSAGLEIRARSGFEQGAYRGTGFYVGPSVTLRFGPTWFALGVLAQVAADKAPEDRGNGEPLEIRDNERFFLRVVAGARP